MSYIEKELNLAKLASVCILSLNQSLGFRVKALRPPPFLAGIQKWLAFCGCLDSGARATEELTRKQICHPVATRVQRGQNTAIMSCRTIKHVISSMGAKGSRMMLQVLALLHCNCTC